MSYDPYAMIRAPEAEIYLNPITVTELIKRTYRKDLNINLEEVRDAFSDGQVASKVWLLRTLLENFSIDSAFNVTLFHGFCPSRYVIVGGWFGLLASSLAMLIARGRIPQREIVTFDYNPTSVEVASKVNARFPLVKSELADAYDFKYERTDLIISTSTEHLRDVEDWAALIPSGALVLAQVNNNIDIEDHVSAMVSLQELSRALGLNEVVFSGALELPTYTRFMIGGRK